MGALGGYKGSGDGLNKIVGRLAEADEIGSGQKMVDRLSRLVGTFESGRGYETPLM